MLEAVIDGIPLPVLIISPARVITLANGAAGELFGRDVTGANAVAVLRQPGTLAVIDGAISEGREGSARFVLSGLAGEHVYQCRACPMPDRSVVVSFEDLSHVEESELRRRDFVANVSHELRTPLTSLMGFIETLRGPARGDVEAQDRFLEIMEREAQRMNRMVSDLLSLSRVEVDERVRPRTEVNVSGVLRSVIATLEGKISDAGVTVEAQDLTERFPVRGDRDQLVQLFLNLLENGLKYGGSGKTLHVSIKKVERDQTLRQPAVRVDIRDEGEGIDPIHIPRLTERFYRVDDHRSRDQGGTGLGLAIVKHIVNRHRGRMKITSEQGVGSCFSVILPFGG